MLHNDLKRLYPSPLAQNAVIRFKKNVWFWTQGALFTNWFTFETQRCESSKKKCVWSSKLKKSKSTPWVWNQTISCKSLSQIKCASSSNFSLLSFELQVTHIFDSNNIVEVWTPGPLFLPLCTPLSPWIKFILFYVTNGTPPIHEESFDTTA